MSTSHCFPSCPSNARGFFFSSTFSVMISRYLKASSIFLSLSSKRLFYHGRGFEGRFPFFLFRMFYYYRWSHRVIHWNLSFSICFILLSRLHIFFTSGQTLTFYPMFARVCLIMGAPETLWLWLETNWDEMRRNLGCVELLVFISSFIHFSFYIYFYFSQPPCVFFFISLVVLSNYSWFRICAYNICIHSLYIYITMVPCCGDQMGYQMKLLLKSHLCWCNNSHSRLLFSFSSNRLWMLLKSWIFNNGHLLEQALPFTPKRNILICSHGYSSSTKDI